MRTLKKLMIVLKIAFRSVFGTTRGLANIEKDLAFLLDKDTGVMAPEHEAFWEDFAKRNGIRKDPSLVVGAGMPGDKNLADGLVSQYLNGTKTAGSGLVRSYEVADDPLPKPGNYWIVLDSNGHPKCVAKTVRVEINPFINVGEEVAVAEGDGSLENWRKAHREFFGMYLTQLGIEDLDQALVVTEFFEVLK